ncbi:response regulator [Acidovorax sp. LjRoot118]|uniref:response regulator n=1 Tax=unclassified Acidovorax TaxID=2684926 RepID=UPI0007090BF6|nr:MULTISPECIES: response regulator [unclassified Acidovorax]KRC16022.1 two-component system response regulator [Acidovorax sp. Root219]KRC19236.1 two-component system response regulator [Acidovorax sp. Root217]
MTARILVIEDDEASRMLVTYLLEADGYQVYSASNGRDGVRAALEHGPDLILSDLQMPVMDGYEVARLLHADPGWRRAPLVAVTAFSMPGDREKALEVGFQDHISKPIDPERFVRQVEAYLSPSSRAVRPPR